MKKPKIRTWVQVQRTRMRHASRYIRHDVWDEDVLQLSAGRRVGVRLLRIVVMVFKGFRDDNCSMHASALTFSTLMSIVPILALMLSMARGLGDAETAKKWLQDRVRDWTATFQEQSHEAESGVEPDTVDMTAQATGNATTGGVASAAAAQAPWEGQQQLADRINGLVERGFERVEEINFARLGTVGLILLIWMVIEVLGRIERSFNRVWGIKRRRTVWRRFTDYISVLVILPVLVGAAVSIPVVDLVLGYMPDRTAAFLQQVVESGFYKNLVVVGMTTLAFAFVIMFMPNTTMRFSSGLSGGFVAGVLFLFWLWLCATVQVGAARYGRIYGSFALIPIVLAWVHVSWQIVLLGAEVAFSVENWSTYRMERNASDASVAARLTLAVMILRETGRAMSGQQAPFEITRFVQERRIPIRFVHAVVAQLEAAGYLAPVAGQPDRYVLIRTPDLLSVRDVLHLLLHDGADAPALGLQPGQLDPAVAKVVKQALGAAEGTVGQQTVASLLKA